MVANHVSGLDPLVMVASCNRPLRFLIAREQYERWWLKWLFRLARVIPVERATNPQQAFYAARAALAAGDVVALFPQGRIQRSGELPRFKRGAVVLAALTGVPIYPLRIEGVRGEGEVVGAVFRPSRVRVLACPPFHCHAEAAARGCLARIQRCLFPAELPTPRKVESASFQ